MAAKESDSFGRFANRSLRSSRKLINRIEKIKDEFSNLWFRDSEEYERIINTSGLENFSIEDWERILN